MQKRSTIDYWNELAVRTEQGTILHQASLERFKAELENYIWSQRTGVFTMSTAWQQMFIAAHSVDIMTADIAKLMTYAEKDLASFIKAERAEVEAKEKTKRMAEKALHYAFDILSPKDHEADRSAILALAAQHMKVEPTAYVATMHQLKEYIATSGIFYPGPPVLSSYFRIKDSKGNETSHKAPENRPFQGKPSAAGVSENKTFERFMSKTFDFTTKQQFEACKKDLNKERISIKDMKDWLAKNAK